MRKTHRLGIAGLQASTGALVPVLVAAGLWISTLVTAAPVQAQERGSAGKSGTTSRGTDSGPSNSGGDDINIDAGDEGKDGPGRGRGSESLLSGIANAPAAVVVVTLVIATMSFYLIALVVWMALNYRTSTAIPAGLVREVQDLLDQTKYNEAYHRLVPDSSFLARVLAAGVRKLPAGLSQAQRACELANESATMEMEHRTTYLATVGTLGPMIGLVGTVYGMIMAFRVIAAEGSTPQANLLASGISTALYATLEGIAISIPAIFFYALFRNRIARLSLEVGMTAEPLLEQFAPGVRAMTHGPGASAAPAAAHPHPFAVNAALAAATTASRPALPAAD
jgi:biopolymer transport protein ExbB